MAVVAPRVAPPQRTLTDRELVAAARLGSDRAFEELYRRYAGRVRGFVAGHVGDPGRAEDLTQEIFLNAVRRLRATETEVAFRPWLFEIARNACIDEFRRGRRGSEVVLGPDELEHAGHPAVAPSPEVAAAARQQLQDLRGAFNGLSPQHHRLLVLRELEGRSYDDIGSRLGMSRPMVESGLFRARRKLHEEYDEIVTGRRCAVVQAALADGGESGLRRLGVRRQRQLSRHLAHCQPCRRAAHDVGLPDHWFRAPTLTGRIAALLPLPWLPWRGSRAAESTAGPLRQLRPVESLGPLADPTGPLQSLGRAAAAVAAILVAGVGGNVVVAHSDGRVAGRPPLRSVAPATSPVRLAWGAHDGRSPVRTRVTPGIPARRPAVSRARAPGGTPRTPGPRTPAADHGAVAATGSHGAASATGSTVNAGPASQVLANATGSVSVPQGAGTALGAAAGVAQAAVAAAQTVGTGSAIPHSVARTVTAAGRAVAASAGTAAKAAGTPAGLAAAPNPGG